MRNQGSDFLSQRRKGAKVREEEVTFVCDRLICPSELGVFATWRENHPNPRLLHWWIICTDAAIHCGQEIP
jgi:hypothetical protein